MAKWGWSYLPRYRQENDTRPAVRALRPDVQRSKRLRPLVLGRRLPAHSLFDFEDRFDLDGGTRGQRSEAQRAPSVISIAILAEQFVHQIRCTVDDEMLVGEVRSRVNAPQLLDHSQPV